MERIITLASVLSFGCGFPFDPGESESAAETSATDSSPSETSTADSSTGMPMTGSESSDTTVSGSDSSDSGSGSDDNESSGGDTTSGACEQQIRPYGECDISCGVDACSDGRTCVGDPETGEASCSDPCDTPKDCPTDVYPEPWSVPVCQAAPISGERGGWCMIACTGDSGDECPNVTVCVDLGGDASACIGEQ